MPTDKKWSKKKLRHLVTPVIWVAAILYTVRSHYTGCPREVILGGWFIAPVIWLMIENLYLYDRNVDDRKAFKKWQWHQRNLWLGMSAYLAVKYLPLG